MSFWRFFWPGRIAGASAEANRAHVAVFVIFALNGFAFANWAARIPAVRDGLGLTPARMGLLLLVGSVGSLLALPLSGLVVQRFGARTTIAVSSVVNGTGAVAIGFALAAGQVVGVGIGALLLCVGTSLWDAAMNLEGAAVERELGVSTMPRLHAGFSLGTVAGAGVGAVAAFLHVAVHWHLLAVVVSYVAAIAVAVRALLPDAHHVDESPGVEATGSSARGRARSAMRAWTEPRTLMIGLVVLAAALTEGAANDWVGLAVVDSFHTDNGTGALAFAAFVLAMTIMRFGGTALLDRYGRLVVLRLCAGLALVGLLVFGLSPSLPLAFVGVMIWGAGAALGFPVGISAASDDPAHAAVRVSVVATIGYSAFLAGPPVLGLLADQVGYRGALLFIVIPVLAGLVVMKAAAPPVAEPSAEARLG